MRYTPVFLLALYAATWLISLMGLVFVVDDKESDEHIGHFTAMILYGLIFAVYWTLFIQFLWLVESWSK